MKGLSKIACAAAFVGATVPGAAQVKSTTPSKVPATGEECASTGEGKVECRKTFDRAFGVRMDSAMMKRAALGLQLSPTGTARDTLGVFVSSVTPKGPAENAGIIEGDRIVSINGVDLRVAPGDIEDGYASGLPSHRLQREVAKLTPGSRVNVRVYSGGRIRDVEVTAGRASDLMRSRAFINFGDGPGSSFIYRDGTDFPPMMQMNPMPQMDRMRLMESMPQMEHMRLMESMPQMEKMREMMPQLERMKMSSEWRRLQELSPGSVYRIRTPSSEWKTRSSRTKVEAERKAKIRADSLKKSK